ncbi:diguanylate cyclase [Rhodoferax sp.]|uniref:sensor domain-containing diguanylate cyclase n=1 Tax=Rhodoferax sp. TaxID=50421 RepID=UPI001EC32F7C|nr:diguanylate cyclase [Rhodoferax sp.]MBT9504955.1 diguanylate cyclase [Rhodoferax sp.]
MGRKEGAVNREGRGVTDADYSFAVNLMQFLVVPTFVLDPDGKVLIWNKACERLTGMPAAEVVGTTEHWRGFYDTPRLCLADLIVQKREAEMAALYVTHDDPSGQSFGLHAQNWCVMPRMGTQLYLAIDAGPIYDAAGKLLAVVETLRDMSAQKKTQIELEERATHDGLTGIVNRRGFDERLQVEWSSASREKQSLALIMIDVDHFKRYNDTYGHLAGDDCLKRIAAVLSQAALRPNDLAARYGGEEFALILPSIDEQGAAVVASRIREGVAKLAIPHGGGEAGGIVTVSLGVATVTPEPSMKHQDLIAWADRALYQAKHAGRNRVAALSAS